MSRWKNIIFSEPNPGRSWPQFLGPCQRTGGGVDCGRTEENFPKDSRIESLNWSSRRESAHVFPDFRWSGLTSATGFRERAGGLKFLPHPAVKPPPARRSWAIKILQKLACRFAASKMFK
jgi:hypothetical protein